MKLVIAIVLGPIGIIGQFVGFSYGLGLMGFDAGLRKAIRVDNWMRS